MSRAQQLRKQYSIAVVRQLTGGEVVEAGLIPERHREFALKQERDLVWMEVEVAFYGTSPAAFLFKHFSLEDSEGYFVAAEPPPTYLDLTLQPGGSGRGALLFSLYTDVAPRRLWFDTGLPFDDSGAPLLLDVPLEGLVPAERQETWAEAAARALDTQLSGRLRVATAEELAAPTLDVDTMLRRVSRELSLPFKKLANGYMFRVSLPDGRKQSVLMTFSGRDEDGAALIKFVTLCAPADDGGANHEVFLRANPNLSYGAIGISRIGGQDFYVMTQTQLLASADPEELIKSIDYLARRGDQLEAELTGGADVR